MNEHCKLARDEFDSLKTTLHDRTRHGPGGQNRASVPDFQQHLDGHVTWVALVDRPHGAKLHAISGRIEWGSAP